jgi:signal peptidase I
MSMADTRARPVAAPAIAWPKPKSQLRELIEALTVALLLALFIRTFFVQAFKIPSGSMLPTLQIGDHILVNKFLYGARIEIPLTQRSLGRLPAIRKPRQGDIIVFIYPKNTEQDFIKRVVAVEGQTVEVRNRQLLIDGQPWDDPHADTTAAGGRDGDNFPGSGEGRPWVGSARTYTVPPEHVFVMGDNRNNSYDSRFWGPVPVSAIKGQAMIIYFSWNGPANLLALPVRAVARAVSAVTNLGWDKEEWVRWNRLGRLVY